MPRVSGSRVQGVLPRSRLLPRDGSVERYDRLGGPGDFSVSDGPKNP